MIHPLDPHTLSESQIKFGIAPRRDPSVEYQPNIILMENGDRAIRSNGSDGLTWTFDANAPQVSDFQIDRIVFATGRAVGRVMSLRRQGDNVQVVLGPVRLTDLIRNGTFAMNDVVNLNNAISYIAPDYPQPSEEEQEKIGLNNHAPGNHDTQRMVMARMSPRGKWTSASMAPSFAEERRVRDWQGRAGSAHLLRLSTNKAADTMLLRTAGRSPQALPSLPAVAQMANGPSLHLPGIPGVEGINPLRIPPEPFNPAKVMGQLPLVALAGGKAIAINGSDTSVGMEYDYDNDGLRVRASGKLILGDSGVKFFLKIKDGGVEECGLRLSGNMRVHLHLNAAAAKDFNANFHKTLYLPIDISLPLGGPVPLSLTFNSTFVLHTAFSAKTSVLNAVGDYSLGAGLAAGYWASKWQFNPGATVSANTDIGDSVEGISVGVNSIILGFGERALVGVGEFGFNAGVYLSVRFTGSAAKAPNITFPCKQGTMDISMETGVGYAIPHWVTDAINFFLKPFTDKTVDPAGTFMRMPAQSLYKKTTQRPEGCVSKGG